MAILFGIKAIIQKLKKHIIQIELESSVKGVGVIYM